MFRKDRREVTFHSCRPIQIDVFSNSADPDETVLSRQDLHYLPYCYWFLNEPLFAAMDVSKFRDGRSLFRISRVKVLRGRDTLGYSCICKMLVYVIKMNNDSNKRLRKSRYSRECGLENFFFFFFFLEKWNKICVFWMGWSGHRLQWSAQRLGPSEISD